ncbi:hypothetical protein DEO72_LG9g1743 [Vigna unguiculata]|uniref:Uncharacterized protein n=1 Tax=Vigna unguiculata TaxID=3917 RepID=A0A4D6N2I9_VIGUN|nr:hypothetical protein DEO72_LG9g1743 [Vigna unguiculata]
MDTVAIVTAGDVPASCGAWREGVLHRAVTVKQGGLRERWRLAERRSRQAVWTSFAWRRLVLRRAEIPLTMLRVTCCVLSNDAILGSGDALP